MRTRKAFALGWKAGAAAYEADLHGFAHKHETLAEAWKIFRKQNPARVKFHACGHRVQVMLDGNYYSWLDTLSPKQAKAFCRLANQ